MSYKLAKNAIYQLKRLYAVLVDVYYPTANSVDLTTGVMTQTSNKTKVRKAILLPAKNDHTSRYTRSYIRSAIYFVYGGEYDTEEQIVLIDMSDLPSKGTTLTTNSWLVIKHKRYEIKSIKRHEELRAVAISAIQLQGAPVYEIHEESVKQSITFAGNTTNTVA